MRFKKYFPIVLLFLVAIFAFTFFAKKETTPKTPAEATLTESSNEPAVVAVKLQTIQESQSLKIKKEYPALVTAKQEAQIIAKTGGVIVSINFDLGDKIQKGTTLAVLDEDNNLSTGETGYKSEQIKQLEIAKETAHESLRLARRNYANTKSKTNKTAKEIAELNRDSTSTALESALERHLVTAPLTGTITQKTTSIGNSITAGQSLGTISATGETTITFFLDEEEVKLIKQNQTIILKDNQKKETPGKITAVSSSADPATKRFLAEAEPLTKTDLSLGTVISVIVETTIIPSQKEAFLLPLSALTIGQNENFIFIAQEGKAKKTAVTVNKISGEIAEVTASLPKETLIVVENNKLLEDNQTITQEK
jgi:RND family efflux transporter MFP subunit